MEYPKSNFVYSLLQSHTCIEKLEYHVLYTLYAYSTDWKARYVLYTDDSVSSHCHAQCTMAHIYWQCCHTPQPMACTYRLTGVHWLGHHMHVSHSERRDRSSIPVLLIRVINPEQKHATYLNGKTPSKAWVIVGGLANAKPFDSRVEWLLNTCCATSSTTSISSSISSTANVNKPHKKSKCKYQVCTMCTGLQHLVLCNDSEIDTVLQNNKKSTIMNVCVT